MEVNDNCFFSIWFFLVGLRFALGCYWFVLSLSHLSKQSAAKKIFLINSQCVLHKAVHYFVIIIIIIIWLSAL